MGDRQPQGGCVVALGDGRGPPGAFDNLNRGPGSCRMFPLALRRGSSEILPLAGFVMLGGHGKPARGRPDPPCTPSPPRCGHGQGCLAADGGEFEERSSRHAADRGAATGVPCAGWRLDGRGELPPGATAVADRHTQADAGPDAGRSAGGGRRRAVGRSAAGGGKGQVASGNPGAGLAAGPAATAGGAADAQTSGLHLACLWRCAGARLGPTTGQGLRGSKGPLV